MKLRFNGNTMRLRLSKTDVQSVKEGKDLVEKVIFGNGQPDFHYALKLSPQSTNIEATGQANEIAVIVPKHIALDWAESDKVGLYHHPSEQQKEALSITIEKDFQCLHKRPGEDETDNFPNPRGGV